MGYLKATRHNRTTSFRVLANVVRVAAGGSQESYKQLWKDLKNGEQ